MKAIEVYQHVLRNKSYAYAKQTESGAGAAPEYELLPDEGEDKARLTEGVVLVDMQTANAVCAVYDAVNPTKQETLRRFSLFTLANIAWKVLAKQ